MIVGHIGGSASDIDTGDIQKSLRFAAGRSTYLSRIITTDATSTYFAVVKRGKTGVISPIFDSSIKFNANDTLTAFGLTTTAVFRDPTSWLFIHVSNGGLFVNGVSFGAVTTSSITNPRIGFDGTNYFDGYIARCGVVGGTSSSYTNFGYFNSEINEWVTRSQSAVKAVVDAGGANSFMLDFDNGTSLTTLGYDKSSKGNNWTLNNHSLTAGVNYDWMDDVPGNSFATLNPLDKGSLMVVADGGLLLGLSGSANQTTRSTIQLPTTGDYYAEVVAGTNTILIGVANPSASLLNWLGSDSGGWSYNAYNGQKYTGGTGAAYGAAYTSGDIIGIKFSRAAGTLEFFKNNTSQGVAFTGLSGDLSISIGCVSSPGATHINFGQRPFTYTPPTGFKALCQANLAGNGTVTLSGSFTGNAAVDGPCVWLNGSPDTLTINGNAVTFGTHADRLATGFKVRSSSASYNTAGSNTFVATVTSNLKNCFKYNNAKDNT